MYKPPPEKRKQTRTNGYTTLTLSGAVLALLTVARAYNLFPDAILVPTVLAAVGSGTGFTLIIYGCVFPRNHETFGHKVRIARIDEVEKIREFAEGLLGNVFPSVEKLRELIAINSEIFYIIEGVNYTTNLMEITGCFSILPLKAGAVEKMEAGKLTAFEFTNAHISQKSRRAKGLYLGTIIGKDRLSKACAIKEAKEAVQAYANRIDILKIFARPITPKGLDLLKKYKFKYILTGGQPEMNRVCMKICSHSIS